MPNTLLAIEILLISAILSVDNALVIGLATRHLAEPLRKKAIFWGTMGAVGLRIAFSLVAISVIDTPFLKLIGGLFLMYIAYKMLADQDGSTQNVRQGNGLFAAIQIIVIADLMVSIDNVLAVVGIAGGNFWLVLLGITVSIPCILWGSHAISRLLHRYPALMFIGVAVLSWTGASMIVEEHMVAAWIAPLAIPEGAFHAVSVVATAAAAMISKRLAV